MNGELTNGPYKDSCCRREPSCGRLARLPACARVHILITDLNVSEDEGAEFTLDDTGRGRREMRRHDRRAAVSPFGQQARPSMGRCMRCATIGNGRRKQRIDAQPQTEFEAFPHPQRLVRKRALSRSPIIKAGYAPCDINACRRSRVGLSTTPFSQMMPVMSSAGVTSKAGLRTETPSGAQRVSR